MKSILISSLAVLVIAMTIQSAQAMPFEMHYHYIPLAGRTIKYEFLNSDIHYVYFTTRTVFPGHGTLFVEVPNAQFQPGDNVKGFAIGLGTNSFTICTDTMQIGTNGLVFDFDVY